jgi:hypothetical protein
MLWWGPGGTSLRRGSRSIVRPLVPAGLPAQVFVVLATAVGVVLVAMAVSRGSALDWVPWTGNPFGP